VVVAVGFTLVEPLADVEVNVPGEMEILVAPVVVQLKVLLAPELIAVGFAVKEEIAGIVGELFTEDELTPPQPASARQASNMTTSAAAFEDRTPPGVRELCSKLQFDELISITTLLPGQLWL